MRLAVDTNVLVYAEGQEAPEKTETARRLLGSRELSVVVPVQVLGEFFRVVTGRYAWTREKAQQSISVFRRVFDVSPTTVAAFDDALELATAHRLQIWDAIIVGVAREAGCAILLSEDMQDGFAWSGVTVVNPFAEPMPAALSRAIQS